MTKQTQPKQTFFLNILIATSHLYLLLILAWPILRWLFADKWWWLFLLNTGAAYLFYPLLPIALIGWFAQRKEIAVGALITALMGLYLFGGLFIPNFHNQPADGQSFTVMSYNTWGYNLHTDDILQVLEDANTDIITIQELNYPLAEAIEANLSQTYPHQYLIPDDGTFGMGILSRFPITQTQVLTGEAWAGIPQTAVILTPQHPITLINIHSAPPGDFNHMPYAAKVRQYQMNIILDAVQMQENPVLVVGDLNEGEFSQSLTMLRNELTDAWREAGQGFGYTHPALPGPANGKWRVRIDYIFYSDELEAISAWLPGWDGQSDHRPVAAELQFINVPAN